MKNRINPLYIGLGIVAACGWISYGLVFFDGEPKPINKWDIEVTHEGETKLWTVQCTKSPRINHYSNCVEVIDPKTGSEFICLPPSDSYVISVKLHESKTEPKLEPYQRPPISELNLDDEYTVDLIDQFYGALVQRRKDIENAETSVSKEEG